jgi:hypothetical protein
LSANEFRWRQSKRIGHWRGEGEENGAQTQTETQSASKLIDLIDINKDEPSVWKSR